MKYSITTLLLLTAIVALGMAGLVNATPTWAHVVVTSVVLLLIGATVVAIHSVKLRPFISGFALAGWVYFLLTTATIGGNTRDNLITSAALAKLYPVLHDEPATSQDQYYAAYRDFVVASLSQRLTTIPSEPSPPSTHFSAIGHSLWTLLIGALGGIVAM